MAVLLFSCPFYLYAVERVIESEKVKLTLEFNEGLNIPDGDTLRLVYIGNSSDPQALLRDSSSNPSYWGGTFWSNYSVLFVNTNGITFGANANIQAAAFIASTLNISNADFLSGNYKFFKDGQNAFILNRGKIVANGGYVALLSQAVENQGTMVANLGTVVLASGEEMTLALDDLNQISVVIIDKGVKDAVLGFDSAVKNSGTISANGGKVILTAKVLNNVFDYAVNNTGIIEAKSLVNHNGVVELVAEGAPVLNTGKIVAGGIKVLTDSGFINKGVISADGYAGLPNGGRISIEAATILQQGKISANAFEGDTAGEVSLVSQTQTTFDSGSTTEAKALGLVGNGGRIIIDSKGGNTLVDKDAVVDVSAGAISGNAGFIEISAFEQLGFYGVLNGRAPPGYKYAVVLFDDPVDITINSPINQTSTYTARATRHIEVNANISVTNGDIILIADSDSDGIGKFTLKSNIIISSNGGNITLQAAEIDLENNSSFNSGSGNIYIRNSMSGRAIALGGGLGGTKLVLDNNELAALNSSGTIIIGSSTAANIWLKSVDFGNKKVSLICNDKIQGTGSGINITTTSLILYAAKGINFNETQVSYLQATNTTQGDINITNTGSLTASSVVNNASGGQINLAVNGDLTVGSPFATDTITLTVSGLILDGNGDSNNVIATNLILSAVNGIGTSGDLLDTQVVTLTASTTTGGVYINEADDIGLNLISANNSDVKIITGGSVFDNDLGTTPGDYDIICHNLTLIVGPGSSIGGTGPGEELDLQYSGTFTENVTPTTSANIPPPDGNNGWNTTNITLTLNASDNGGSGVASITYFDGTSWHTNSGSFVSFTVSSEGINTIQYYATDNSGNNSTTQSQNIKLDKTPPEIEWGDVTPEPNAAGWNNDEGVTIDYTISDTYSGVDGDEEATLSFTDEGGGQTQPVTVTDKAGNSQTFVSPAVNIDKTPPTINAQRYTPANTNGWNNTDVLSSYTASDALSGLDSASTGSYTFTTESVNQSHAFTVMDKAGNSRTAAVSGVNIDKTAPIVTATANIAANAAGWYNSDVTVNVGATDALSGIALADPSVTVTIEGDNVVVTRTATDAAGNIGSASITLKIDKTAPTITCTSPTDGLTYDAAQTLLYTTSDTSGSGIYSVIGPLIGTVYNTLGTHSIFITATDLAGNSGFVALSFAIEMPAFTESQLSNATIFRLLLPSLEQLAVYQINTFSGAVYFYHPLTPFDMSAFDQFILEEGAYEFIDGAINIIGHEGLLPLLEGIKRKKS